MNNRFALPAMLLALAFCMPVEAKVAPEEAAKLGAEPKIPGFIF